VVTNPALTAALIEGHRGRGLEDNVWRVAPFLFSQYIARMLWRLRNSRGRPLNAPAAFIHWVSQSMKSDELLRNVPANVHELRLALAGLPNDMKVIADPQTGVFEKTVAELLARTTWPPGFAVTTPRELHPKSVVKIRKNEPYQGRRAGFKVPQQL
jgi:hypothetical protein